MGYANDAMRSSNRSMLSLVAPLVVLVAVFSAAYPSSIAAAPSWPWPVPPAAHLAAAQQTLTQISLRCAGTPTPGCPLEVAEARAAWMELMALDGRRAEVDREAQTLLDDLPSDAMHDPRWTALLHHLALRVEEVEMLAVASDLLERELTLTQEQSGPGSRETLALLMRASAVAREIDAGKRSRPHAAEALTLAEQLDGPGSATAAEARALQGSVWQGVNFPLSSIVSLEDGIRVLEEERGVDHPSVAEAHVQIAKIASQSRDAPLFDEHIDRAIAALRAEGSPPERLAYALYLRGYEHAIRSEPEDSPATLDPARSDIHEALALLQASPVPRPYTLAQVTHAVAELAVLDGDVQGSVELRQRSLELFEASVGSDNDDAMNMQISLAWTLSHLGRHAEALEVARRIYKAHEDLGGPGNWGLGTKARALALVAAYAGDEETARDAIKVALEVHTRRGLHAAEGLDERRGLNWIARGRQSVDLALTMLLRPEDDRLLWEYLVKWTGVVRNAAMSRHWARLASPEGLEQARKLGEARAALAAAVAALDDPVRIAALAEARDRLERTITLTMKGLLPDLEAVGVAEICAALGPGEALVHTITYRAMDPFHESPLTPRHDAVVAFVATGPGCTTLRRVNLAAPGQISSAVLAWRDALEAATDRSGSRVMVEQTGAELRTLAWDPIARAMGDARRVYIVPDGTLTLVPYAALPTPEGGYLLDQLEFSYLDTARDFALPSRLPAPAGVGALLLGDVDYGGRRLAGHRSRPPVAPCSSEPFGPLPGTTRELRRVSRRLRGAEIAVDRLTGARANAVLLADHAPGRRILHIAAHGFAPGTGCASISQDLAPLTLSGLALARATLGGDPASGPDDGLLTAEEIGGLDLRDTELVVLSACGSALGATRSGEGVIGLRRAFAVAGARVMIGALGPVDDRATTTLIDQFYERYLSGRSPMEALNEAQRRVLAAQRQAGKVRVEDWGLFVASGR